MSDGDHMHLLYLIILLAMVLVFNWRYLGLNRLGRGRRGGGAAAGRPPAPARECRWSKDASRGEMLPARFECAVCGAEGYSSDGAPPAVCRRAARDAG
ncbi:MAG: hypothetical protein AAFR16_10195 [Pseudomonadota bacterium]